MTVFASFFEEYVIQTSPQQRGHRLCRDDLGTYRSFLNSLKFSMTEEMSMNCISSCCFSLGPLMPGHVLNKSLPKTESTKNTLYALELLSIIWKKRSKVGIQI